MGSHEAGSHEMGSGVPLSRGRGMSDDVRVPRMTNGDFYCGRDVVSGGEVGSAALGGRLVVFHGASDFVGNDGASSCAVQSKIRQACGRISAFRPGVCLKFLTWARSSSR